MSDWQYRTDAIEISQRGYRTPEPAPTPRETSQVFAKVSAALRQDCIAKEDVADELKTPMQEIEQLVFGLLMTGVTTDQEHVRTNRRSKPKLYVIK